MLGRFKEALVVNTEKEPMWWHTLVGKVVNRVRQEKHEFKASLCYNFVPAMKTHVYNPSTWKWEQEN